jgi:hypothetical protein
VDKSQAFNILVQVTEKCDLKKQEWRLVEEALLVISKEIADPAPPLAVVEEDKPSE